jgi:inner membrane protein
VLLFYIREPISVIGFLFLYLFLCTVSHGVLDAMTNGGLGVGFLSPFNTTRYFFGFRPIVVSPIGVDRFFSGRALQVLVSEFKWIWLPSFLFVLGVRASLRLVRTSA